MKSNPSCVLTKEKDIIDVVIWTLNMQKCGLFISSLQLKFKVKIQEGDELLVDLD
jgi:hypothetical protein